MIRGKAIQVLESLIGDKVEFLPLVHNCISEVYYLLQVFNVLDVIDSDKAVKKTITGLIVGYRKSVFNIILFEMK